MIEIPNPPAALDDAPEYLRASWKLGFHDGYSEISPAIGEGTLSALIVETWDHKSRLEVATAREESIIQELGDAREDLVPGFGSGSIGPLPKILAMMYVILAFLAIGAEFSLSGITVGEALGNVSRNDLAPFRHYLVPALALNLCLIGWSAKILVDAVEQHRRKAWRSMIVVAISIACTVLCAVSLWGAAGLREAIGHQEGIAAQVAQLPPHDQAEALRPEIAEVANRAAYTFRWLSLALPLFSAACIIMATHQVRDFRRHELAARKLVTLSDERIRTTTTKASLMSSIASDLRYRKGTDDGPIAPSEAMERAVATYRHGYACGEARLLEQRGQQRLFTRLVAKLNQGRL